TGGTRPPGHAELPADRSSVVSFVLVREDDDWRVAAFQNTRAQRLADPASRSPVPGGREAAGHRRLEGCRGGVNSARSSSRRTTRPATSASFALRLRA